MDANNGTTTYSYDYAGNELTQTDANTHVTTYTYDNMNRRKTRTLPLGQTETYNYDNTGCVTSKTTFNGDVISYGYDQKTDRLTSKSMPGVNVNYTYYPGSGTRWTMTDNSGLTTYTYDSYMGKYLVKKAGPEGTLNYAYAAGGQLTWVYTTDKNGAPETNGVNIGYQYDKTNGTLSAVTDNILNSTTAYTYDTYSGNLNVCAYPNGVTTTYNYDPDNRLTWVGMANNTGTINSFGYTLAPAGNKTGVAENNGRTVAWVYDNLYRLTNETVTNNPVSSTSPNYNAGYSYDPVGNRQARATSPTGILPDQSFSGEYDNNDRLTASGYGYNGNGSTTTAPNGWTYTYDDENHLLSVTGNGVNITYVYDGDGIRVMKNTNGTIIRYLTDDKNPTGYVQVLEELNGGYAVQKRYTYGLDLISQTSTLGTTGTQYYGYDGIGSVRQLYDTTGAITDTYDYDAFGMLIYQNGITPNVYLFQGQQYDPDLGQYYLRARYMQMNLGRFWTMDNFEGILKRPITLNKYIFASNNSINKIDPLGLDDIEFCMASIDVADIMSVNSNVKIPTKNEYKVGLTQIHYSKLLYTIYEGAGATASYTINGYYKIEKKKVPNMN